MEAAILKKHKRVRIELDDVEKELRRDASEMIGRLITNIPRWTLEVIGEKVGLSKSSVVKIRAQHEDISIAAVKKLLETTF